MAATHVSDVKYNGLEGEFSFSDKDITIDDDGIDVLERSETTGTLNCLEPFDVKEEKVPRWRERFGRGGV